MQFFLDAGDGATLDDEGQHLAFARSELVGFGQVGRDAGDALFVGLGAAAAHAVASGLGLDLGLLIDHLAQ